MGMALRPIQREAIEVLSKVIVAIKADDVSLKLQNEFYEKSTHPLGTPQ